MLIFIASTLSAGWCSNYRIISHKFSKGEKVKMKIPNNFVFEGLEGDNEKEYRYWYPDSSVIYITTFENTLNYEAIRQQNTYYKRFDAIYTNDTLTLEGRKPNNTFWKDKLLATGVTIGYSAVPKRRLGEFEKALSSTKR